MPPSFFFFQSEERRTGPDSGITWTGSLWHFTTLQSPVHVKSYIKIPWVPEVSRAPPPPPPGGGALPSNRLMGMCRWMGLHFHDWIDHNEVPFSIGLLECSRIFSGFGGKNILASREFEYKKIENDLRYKNESKVRVLYVWVIAWGRVKLRINITRVFRNCRNCPSRISVRCEALHIAIKTANDESKRTCGTISSTDFDWLL